MTNSDDSDDSANPYGRPPSDPPPDGGYAQPGGQYGQPGQYGAQAAQPGAYAQSYGQPANPYGQQANPYGGQHYAQLPPSAYAHWGKRVGALLIDGLLTLLAGTPLLVGFVIIFAGATTTTTGDGQVSIQNDSISPAGLILVLLGIITYLAFFIWNTFIKQGRTGYTIGKGVLGIKLISESTGQPIGAGSAFVRQIAHFLDGLFYIGYLWPLWDSKRQTFADKIMSSVVIEQPRPS